MIEPVRPGILLPQVSSDLVVSFQEVPTDIIMIIIIRHVPPSLQIICINQPLDHGEEECGEGISLPSLVACREALTFPTN